MRVAAVCPTYKRPNLLGRVIHCFLQQTYKDCELLVLDDVGQYNSQEHERWRLVSTDKRYPSIGAKRQAAINMLSKDCEAVISWDDDDVYWPHAIASAAKALETRPWAQCSLVYESGVNGTLRITEAMRGTKRKGWGYGGCWAHRLQEHCEIGGYPLAMSMSDDLDLAFLFEDKYGPAANSTPNGKPWYWYNRDPGVWKISDEGVGFWEMRGKSPFQRMSSPTIGWNGRDMYNLVVEPGVHQRPF